MEIVIKVEMETTLKLTIRKRQLKVLEHILRKDVLENFNLT